MVKGVVQPKISRGYVKVDGLLFTQKNCLSQAEKGNYISKTKKKQRRSYETETLENGKGES